MNMRTPTLRSSLAALAVAILALPATTLAQDAISDQEVAAIIEAARSELRASREQLLAANLSLTQAEADAFWPLYRQYNAEKARFGDERLQIIKDYASAYPDVDDATAASLVDRSVKNSKASNKFKQQYVGKFRKVLPPVKLMRFLQIESRVDNLVELQIQRSIPVVEPAS
jgi:Spy/CpxP family protein refolding chaperone